MYRMEAVEGMFAGCPQDRELIYAIALLSSGEVGLSGNIRRKLRLRPTWPEDVDWLLGAVRTRLQERGIEDSSGESVDSWMSLPPKDALDP